jgi:hypothetical protein
MTEQTKKLHWVDDWIKSVNEGYQWNTTPLRRDDRPAPYPVERLPGVIGKAVQEVADYVQAPVALVAGCALSAVSAAVQTQFTVWRDERLHSPASLYFLTVAESGQRKSTVDNMFIAPIREWEARQRLEAERRDQEYREALEAWEREEPKGKKPEKPPATPKMLRGDDTPEALVRHLSSYPIAAIISAEAGVIFGSHAMNPDVVQRNLGQANALWDGGPVMEGRIGRGETNIPSARVTMGLMVQPKPLDNFIAKSGGMARGIGYLARFLFCHPESTMGTRFYRDPPPMPALAQFQNQVTLLLQWHAAVDELGSLITHRVELDADAKQAWINFYNEVEEFMGGDDIYSGIKDVASKAAENAARLACCLHVFTTQGTTPITRRTMDAACSLMRWYLDEAVRFATEAETTEEVRNAELLEAWLVQKWKEAKWAKESWSMTVNTARQKGPNSLRGGKRFDHALDLLVDHNRIAIVTPLASKSKNIYISPQVIAEYS